MPTETSGVAPSKTPKMPLSSSTRGGTHTAGGRQKIEEDRIKYLHAMDRGAAREDGEEAIRDATIQHRNVVGKLNGEISNLKKRHLMEHASLTTEEKASMDLEVANKTLEIQSLEEDHQKQIIVLRSSLVQLSDEDLLFVRGSHALRKIEAYKYRNTKNGPRGGKIGARKQPPAMPTIAREFMDFFEAHAASPPTDSTEPTEKKEEKTSPTEVPIKENRESESALMGGEEANGTTTSGKEKEGDSTPSLAEEPAKQKEGEPAQEDQQETLVDHPQKPEGGVQGPKKDLESEESIVGEKRAGEQLGEVKEEATDDHHHSEPGQPGETVPGVAEMEETQQQPKDIAANTKQGESEMEVTSGEKGTPSGAARVQQQQPENNSSVPAQQAEGEEAATQAPQEKATVRLQQSVKESTTQRPEEEDSTPKRKRAKRKDHDDTFEELQHRDIEQLKSLVTLVDFNSSGKMEAEDLETLIRRYLFSETGISSLEVERIMLLLGAERYESKVYDSLRSVYYIGLQLYVITRSKKKEFEEIKKMSSDKLRDRRLKIDQCQESRDVFEAECLWEINIHQTAANQEGAAKARAESQSPNRHSKSRSGSHGMMSPSSPLSQRRRIDSTRESSPESSPSRRRPLGTKKSSSSSSPLADVGGGVSSPTSLQDGVDGQQKGGGPSTREKLKSAFACRREKRLNWAATAIIATAFEENKQRAAKLCSAAAGDGIGGRYKISTQHEQQQERSQTMTSTKGGGSPRLSMKDETPPGQAVQHVHTGRSCYHAYFKQERVALKKIKSENEGGNEGAPRSYNDSLKNAFLRAPLPGGAVTCSAPHDDEGEGEAKQKKENDDLRKLFKALSGQQEFLSSAAIASRIFSLFTPAGSDAAEVDRFFNDEWPQGLTGKEAVQGGITFRQFLAVGPLLKSRAERPQQFAALSGKEKKEVIKSKQDRNVPLTKYELQHQRSVQSAASQAAALGSRGRRYATSSFLTAPHPTAVVGTGREGEETLGFALRAKRRQHSSGVGNDVVSPGNEKSRSSTGSQQQLLNHHPSPPPPPTAAAAAPADGESVDWGGESNTTSTPVAQKAKCSSARRRNPRNGSGSSARQPRQQSHLSSSPLGSAATPSGQQDPATLAELGKQLRQHRQDDDLVAELADLYALISPDAFTVSSSSPVSGVGANLQAGGSPLSRHSDQWSP